jgi:tRNA modification GTPase
VVDCSVDLDEHDREIRELIKGKRAIALLNKQDLQSRVLPENFEKEFYAVIPFSAKERTGMEELETCLKQLFLQESFPGEERVQFTNIRQMDALEESMESLRLVQKSIEEGMPEDFFSIDLMNSYEALGRIIGESLGEDLIQEIFSRFCMGK